MVSFVIVLHIDSHKLNEDEKFSSGSSQQASAIDLRNYEPNTHLELEAGLYNASSSGFVRERQMCSFAQEYVRLCVKSYLMVSSWCREIFLDVYHPISIRI